MTSPRPILTHPLTLAPAPAPAPTPPSHSHTHSAPSLITTSTPTDPPHPPTLAQQAPRPAHANPLHRTPPPHPIPIHPTPTRLLSQWFTEQMEVPPLVLDVDLMREKIDLAVSVELQIHSPEVHKLAVEKYDSAVGAQKEVRDARRREAEAELSLRITSVLSVNVPVLTAALEKAAKADAAKDLIERAQARHLFMGWDGVGWSKVE